MLQNQRRKATISICSSKSASINTKIHLKDCICAVSDGDAFYILYKNVSFERRLHKLSETTFQNAARTVTTGRRITMLTHRLEPPVGNTSVLVFGHSSDFMRLKQEWCVDSATKTLMFESLIYKLLRFIYTNESIARVPSNECSRGNQRQRAKRIFCGRRNRRYGGE